MQYFKNFINISKSNLKLNGENIIIKYPNIFILETIGVHLTNHLFLKKFLNKYFFNKDFKDITKILRKHLLTSELEELKKIHELKYLPIEIYSYTENTSIFLNKVPYLKIKIDDNYKNNRMLEVIILTYIHSIYNLIILKEYISNFIWNENIKSYSLCYKIQTLYTYYFNKIDAFHFQLMRYYLKDIYDIPNILQKKNNKIDTNFNICNKMFQTINDLDIESFNENYYIYITGDNIINTFKIGIKYDFNDFLYLYYKNGKMIEKYTHDVIFEI